MSLVLFISVAFLACIAEFAEGAYTGASKPMQFYFHNINAPVSVAGLETKYIMNTTRSFSYLTQEQAYSNSFFKPASQPKIVVAFYLYPNFAGPVTLNGTWQVFIWANSSAYRPVGFSLSFQEVSVGGQVLWSSGGINPIVTSSIGSYLDVPVFNYNLSAPLIHSFSVDTTLLVEVEVNAGSSADIRLWYDSPQYPSKLILPANDYARPVSVGTYSVDNTETTLFHYNWSESRRKVIVRANVTDPFGGYDVHRVNLTISDPEGMAVVENTEMTRISNGQWTIGYAHVFEANWSYPTTAALGDYTVAVSVIDYNGYYKYNETGSYQPFIETETQAFTIGVVVYYDPAFIVTDDVDETLPHAQVYVVWPNGTKDIDPRYTSETGFLNLTDVPVGNYGFIVLWKDSVVKDTIVHVDSDGPFRIKTEVYVLTLQVLTNAGAPVHSAYVMIYTQSGVGYGLEVTDNTGRAVFRLSSGTYRVTAHYSADYWLRMVKTSATEEFSVTQTASRNLVLQDFPPPVWSTMGFWLLMMGFVAAVFGIIFIVRRRVIG
ncbi:MAG: hypothetical protein JSV64_07665 [Candidatus Bathyarchaeota archaeon]|nr:MAG: hypothetical protein JSV64_07665 [Candidatus Bathyarchaeota archaeon]